ncbi:MAG: TlpA disulfide reductase family protein [Verrucomicrobiota bacterium]
MNATSRNLLFTFLAAAGLMTARAGEFPDNWTWDDTPADRALHASLEGKPMPALAGLTGWVNGEVKPADLKGKVVVVDFYATWCGPCMAAIPHNNEMLKKFKEKGLVIVGVCTSSRGQDKMATVVSQRGITYPTAMDPKLTAERAWRVNYYPTYAIVDRKGNLRALGVQPEYVDRIVTKLLAEPAS